VGCVSGFVRPPRHARRVPKRPPFTPSDDDLRQLTEHLFYEVQMTFFLAAVLVKAQRQPPPAAANQFLINVHVEAFTMHLRQLIDFLWGERSARSGTNAFAADYFAPGEWAKLRPERPEILSEAIRRKVGWGVVHLTYERAWSTPLDKQWDFDRLARGLAPAVICFVDNVDRAKLDREYFDHIRQWPEQFL
jgi:hypothetical protein